MYSGTSKIYQAACRNLRETMSKNGNRSNKSRLSYTKKHVALRPAGADEVCFCISWFSLHFCKLWSETPGHVICLCQWLLRHRPSPWPQWRGVSALNSDEVCVKSLTKIKIPCMWFRFMQKIQLAILWLFNYCVGVLRPGILAAIKGVLRLRPGSLCWLGIPCSLLIWVSLGTSKRGTLFDMFGDISLESVRKSNIHLGRAATAHTLVCSTANMVGCGTAWVFTFAKDALLCRAAHGQIDSHQLPKVVMPSAVYVGVVHVKFACWLSYNCVLCPVGWERFLEQHHQKERWFLDLGRGPSVKKHQQHQNSLRAIQACNWKVPEQAHAKTPVRDQGKVHLKWLISFNMESSHTFKMVPSGFMYVWYIRTFKTRTRSRSWNAVATMGKCLQLSCSRSTDN